MEISRFKPNGRSLPTELNPAPEHLGTALRFLEKHSTRYPFEAMVGRTFPMTEINDAINSAASGDHIRVAVVNS